MGETICVTDHMGSEVPSVTEFALIPVYEGLRNATVDEGFLNSYAKLANTFKSSDKPAVPRETVQVSATVGQELLPGQAL